MSWQKQTFKVTPPQWILDIKNEIESIYIQYIEPLIGANFPPTLGGTLGSAIAIAKQILGNIQPQILDPFNAFLSSFLGQVESIVDDTLNTGMEFIFISPQNVDGAVPIKTPLEESDIPSNIKNAIGSGWANLEQSAIDAIKASTSVYIKGLTPQQAINELIQSLDDTNDVSRPQYSDTAYVAGFGLLLTANTYVSIQRALSSLKALLDIKDITDYVDGFSSRINSKKSELADVSAILEEWNLQNIQNKYYGHKATYSELSSLYKTYKTSAYYPDTSFHIYLGNMYNQGSLFKPVTVFSKNPDWTAVTLSSTFTVLRDLEDFLGYAIGQIKGYATDATNSIIEAINIIETKINQLVAFLSAFMTVIQEFINLPSFDSIYTIYFDGVGGNNFIKKQVQAIDLTGIGQNNFSVLAMFIGGTTSLQAFKNFSTMFAELGNTFANIQLVDPQALKTFISSLSYYGTNDYATLNIDNITGLPIEPITPPSIAPTPITDGTSAPTSSGSNTTTTVEPPIIYSSTNIVDGGIYPPFQPYWKVDETIETSSAILQTLGFETINNFLNLVTSEPISPNDGDTYIATATGTSNITSTSVTINRLYTWNKIKGIWVEFIPISGEVVLNSYDSTRYSYSSGSWVVFTGVGTMTRIVSSVPFLPNTLISKEGYYRLIITTKKLKNNLVSSETFNFIINNFSLIPPKIYPLNLQDGQIVSNIPLRILWNEKDGCTSAATISAQNGSVTSGTYYKGTPLYSNDVYTFTITTYQVVTSSLTNTQNTVTNSYTFSITLDDSWYVPNNISISGVQKYKVYTVPVIPSWSPTGNIIVSATLQKNVETPISFTSGTTISDDGTYKLTVTTQNSIHSTEPSLSSTDIYTFIIDKVYPESPSIVFSETVEGKRYEHPIALYWSSSPGYTMDVKISNSTTIPSPISYIMNSTLSDNGEYTLVETMTNVMNPSLTVKKTVSFVISYPHPIDLEISLFPLQ